MKDLRSLLVAQSKVELIADLLDLAGLPRELKWIEPIMYRRVS